MQRFDSVREEVEREREAEDGRQLGERVAGGREKNGEGQRERERGRGKERERGEGREREGERESQWKGNLTSLMAQDKDQ